jgi:hypothetical protein
MEKRKTKTRFQKRRTLRLSAGEDEKLTQQAATAGISVSEYMRRLFFGGRPIIARTDDRTIRELQRLGGLLKHHFDVVRRTGRQSICCSPDSEGITMIVTPHRALLELSFWLWDAHPSPKFSTIGFAGV